MKHTINDAVQLDTINWEIIANVDVRVFHDEWYGQCAPEYILLTKKDCMRLKRCYPRLPENFEIIELAQGCNTFGGILDELGGVHSPSSSGLLWVYALDVKTETKHLTNIITARHKLIKKNKQNEHEHRN